MFITTISVKKFQINYKLIDILPSIFVFLVLVRVPSLQQHMLKFYIIHMIWKNRIFIELEYNVVNY